jgi:hypothetical protein
VFWAKLYQQYGWIYQNSIKPMPYVKALPKTHYLHRHLKNKNNAHITRYLYLYILSNNNNNLSVELLLSRSCIRVYSMFSLFTTKVSAPLLGSTRCLKLTNLLIIESIDLSELKLPELNQIRLISNTIHQSIGRLIELKYNKPLYFNRIQAMVVI